MANKNVIRSKTSRGKISWRGEGNIYSSQSCLSQTPWFSRFEDQREVKRGKRKSFNCIRRHLAASSSFRPVFSSHFDNSFCFWSFFSWFSSLLSRASIPLVHLSTFANYHSGQSIRSQLLLFAFLFIIPFICHYFFSSIQRMRTFFFLTMQNTKVPLFLTENILCDSKAFQGLS